MADNRHIYPTRYFPTRSTKAVSIAIFKVRGPFVQTLCIEKDSYMDTI